MSFKVRGSVVALVSLFAFACGGSPSSSGSPSDGNGGPGASTPESPNSVVEKGTITDFNTKRAVSGATVTVGAHTTTTGDDGSFSLTLTKGEPAAFTVTADGYATLLEQDTALQADYDRGKTTIVPASLASILTAMLSGYDATLGVLSVQVVATGACASEAGATIAIDPPGSAKVAYFSAGLPSTSLTAVKAGEFPSAVVYNVQPGVNVSLKVTETSCTQAAYPFTQGPVEYTGIMTTQPGQTTSFARVFMQ